MAGNYHEPIMQRLESGVTALQGDITNILTDTGTTLPSQIAGIESTLSGSTVDVSSILDFVSGLPGTGNTFRSRSHKQIIDATEVDAISVDSAGFIFIQAWAESDMTGTAEVTVYDGSGLTSNIIGKAYLIAGTSQIVCCYPAYSGNGFLITGKSDGTHILHICSTFSAAVSGSSSQITTMDDTYIYNGAPTTNYGNQTGLALSNATTPVINKILIRPDLSGISSSAQIQSAILSLKSATTRALTDVYVRILLRPWVELQATYNDYSTGNAWETAGALGALDRISSPVWSGHPSLIAGEWWSIDVTSAVQSWVSGLQTNYGFLISCDVTSAGNQSVSFRSSEYATPTDRPKLDLMVL